MKTLTLSVLPDSAFSDYTSSVVVNNMKTLTLSVLPDSAFSDHTSSVAVIFISLFTKVLVKPHTKQFKRQ